MLQLKTYVFAVSLVAALGGFLFGFDTVVISGTTEQLETLFELDDFWLGFTVTTALVGTILGAMGVGLPTERFGRRAMLMVMAVLYLVSALGCAFAWNWEALVVFRFIGGLGVGGASVLSPMYIAEIAPAKERGQMVALAQFNIVLGILLAFVSNYTIVRMELDADAWRWMFGVEAVPAFLFGVLLWLIPRSPRWLVSRGRYAEAASTLKRVEGDPTVAEAELEAIRVSFHVETQSPREPLFQAKYVKVMLLAVAITAFNQLSGINAILYYAPKVIKLTGVATEDAMLQSIIIGVVNLVFTMLALTVIDRMGRRKLMLIGSLGYLMSLSTCAAVFFMYGESFSHAAGYVLLAALSLFIAAHAFGQGAVVWVFVSEIFPNRIRARGQALGAFSIWVFAAIVSQLFPIVLGGLGGGTTFALFCGFMALQLLWVLFVMPETKGIPLEEMEATLGLQDD